jgi:hypothetical protein
LIELEKKNLKKREGKKLFVTISTSHLVGLIKKKAAEKKSLLWH